jgi:hypothetical protein
LKGGPIYRDMSVENSPWYKASGIWRCNKQASLKSAGTRWSTHGSFKEVARCDWPSYSRIHIRGNIFYEVFQPLNSNTDVRINHWY